MLWKLTPVTTGKRISLYRKKLIIHLMMMNSAGSTITIGCIYTFGTQTCLVNIPQMCGTPCRLELLNQIALRLHFGRKPTKFPFRASEKNKRQEKDE